MANQSQAVEETGPQPGDAVRVDGYERRVMYTYTEGGRDRVRVKTYGHEFGVTLHQWRRWCETGEVLHG